MAVLQFTTAYAQQKTISGTVTSAQDGMPLPGVNVVVEETSNGTVTDMDGKFSLMVSDNDVVIFSMMGFTSQEIVVSSQTTINVALETDYESLEEVVVTALGITRDRKSLGYATQEVDGDDLTLTNEQNVIGSLAGKVAGVQVTGSSGASMGGTQKIKIRGVNSISGSDQPLIVVDGTPISNANFAGSAGADLGNLGQDVNPSDIETVNVLKGPAASALYGIRGQYGVIMITTKKGRKGVKDINVELNSSFTVDRVGEMMPTQNLYGGGSSQTFPTLPNGDPYVDMLVDESWGPRMDGTPVRHIFSFYPQDPTYGQLTPFSPYPDNLRDYYQTGYNLSNGVTVTGGGENSSIRVSLNDTRIEGVEPNTELNRNNFGVSASLDIVDNLSVSTNFNYATNNARRPSQGSEVGANYLIQWFQRNIDMNRMKDYQYDDGTFLHWNLRRPSSSTGELTNFNPVYWNNPYFEAYENTTEDNRDRFFGDIGLAWDVTDHLELSAFVRSDMYTQNIESHTAFGGKGLPGYSIGKYQNREMNYEFLASYNNSWDDFSLNANLGGNIWDRRYSYLSQATVGGLSSPGYYNIDASIDRPSVSDYLLRKEVRSAFAMVSLGYQDTYFLDASIRNDVSSALPEDDNSYWYPSVSGSFVFSELMNWDALNFGKLRASYAQAGSDLSPYTTTRTYGVGAVYNGVTHLAVPNNLFNPNIKPSFAHSYEAGIDLRFFNNRLGIDFTYYEQQNRDQIISLDLSGTSGYSYTNINAGLIENKGVELALTARPIETPDFNWDMTFNINNNKSMVVELHPDINVYTHGSTTYSSVTTYLNSYEDEAFGSLVGPAYQRDEATGQILLDNNNMPMYTDNTHNFGSVLPDFNGGFSNTFRYKNFDLSAMIDFQGGGQFFSRSKMLSVRTGQDPLSAAINENGANVRDPLDQGGGVKVEGISASTGEQVSTFVDAKTYYNNFVGRRIYEDWLYDASYVRLREVRLGYTFGQNIMQRLPFQAINIAFIAKNPLMIWQDAPEGLNPAEISTGSQSISWYESGQLSSVRSYGVNLNITF